jgi:hypothetical protein
MNTFFIQVVFIFSKNIKNETFLPMYVFSQHLYEQCPLQSDIFYKRKNWFYLFFGLKIVKVKGENI